MLRVLAPAKVNLTLEVLGKRSDGYHEIRSVMQTVGLCDTFEFETDESVSAVSANPDWKAEESLVMKAVLLVKESTGFSGGVRIRVDKKIPMMAGLGGDSSDAATVLRGLDSLWNLHLSQQEMRGMAGQLGSDVYFFLRGGTALVEGRGELVHSLPPLPSAWLVIAVPPVPRLPGKTARIYGKLTSNYFTGGEASSKLITDLEAGKPLDPALIFNTFESVVFERFAGQETAREHFMKLGAGMVHLVGSGPAMFTVVESWKRGEELAGLLKKQKMESYLVETTGPFAIER